MKKIRLRKQVVSVFLGILFIVPIVAFVLISSKGLKESKDYPQYINDSTIEDTIPVINSSKKIINPYNDSSVSIIKNYYDYKSNEEKQLNSIIVHENTYIQNTGIDFGAESEFDVVAVLEGTVINVKEDEMTGKMIEVKNDDDYIVIYQSLSEINVKKGDIINQGQIIGKSGKNELDNEMGNHLHFEVYNNGQNMNPEVYLNTEQKIKGEE